MSDNYLRIFPDSQSFVPASDAIERALEIVNHAFPGADEISAERHDHPVFLDPGANLERVICSACGAKTGRGSEWWEDLSDPHETNVACVIVRMRCCGAEVSFTTLEFEWPAGFASFVISVLNPGVPTGLDAMAVQDVEQHLGCNIRQIWAHL